MQYSLILLALFVAGSFAQFSSTAQQAIVDAHNNLRSQIAKGTYVAKGTKKQSGADILKLKWDSSIGTSAQNYANTCPTGHSGAAGLGENIYWSWTSGTFGALDSYGVPASNSWQQEFQDYGWTSNTLDVATFNTGIGHATQMAWSKTGSLGCGIKNCGPDASMNNWNRLVVVCQYKAQGNVLNNQIYQTGATCSACPSGTSCESASGLCI
uniref:SCP domain-containing protein n=1 Tax=Caenorhabditis japonica TaxID=281687 RepID=A0A8R1DUE7_CAEJA